MLRRRPACSTGGINRGRVDQAAERWLLRRPGGEGGALIGRPASGPSILAVSPTRGARVSTSG